MTDHLRDQIRSGAIGETIPRQPPSCSTNHSCFSALDTFLNHLRLQIPEDLSAVVLDAHPVFAWSHPAPTHLTTDPAGWVRKVMQWINRVSRGKIDQRKSVLQAKIREGGTIGPAPRPSLR